MDDVGDDVLRRRNLKEEELKCEEVNRQEVGLEPRKLSTLLNHTETTEGNFKNIANGKAHNQSDFWTTSTSPMLSSPSSSPTSDPKE
ncbi:hypothetical protein GCK72_005196 [Caenorhabditis remanei]|uniref:Uncharacterized protein n=1 Tax=Caenorhabditis remanei TaxID=31234 RepID=A0A6A5HEI6_CAERE|nr:hypothetical protein GCK72_005196 [Caenorhabditis remanei]KAF1765244.1 hypothetical protein GCK72_005196 [Caenorhabditis remanei]